ncbi:hypothetical protein CL654_00940 [bacterium]|nr:hypothetical protein [bacterium]|tara:strand:- start:1006 stop:1746 length:741 start_codon:yes stop_codon:yes gene_type:complete
MFITDIFNSVIFIPLYNALIFFTGLTGGSIGASVIILTLLVKFAILPLSHKSVTTQAGLRKLDPEIKKLKEKHKNNQQDQARAIMELYKEHGINPFSGCILTLIQIPIIFGLYWVFWRGLSSGVVNPDLLYSSVPMPEMIAFKFFGFDLIERSIILSLIAGVSQYFLMKLSIPPIKPEEKKPGEALTFADEFKKGLGTQMRYVLPVMIAVISFGFPAVVPLYWFTSNLFSIVHELLVKRKAKELLA